jgi:hypothetical protein
MLLPLRKYHDKASGFFRKKETIPRETPKIPQPQLLREKQDQYIGIKRMPDSADVIDEKYPHPGVTGLIQKISGLTKTTIPRRSFVRRATEYFIKNQEAVVHLDDKKMLLWILKDQRSVFTIIRKRGRGV